MNIKCPKCGSRMHERSGRMGRFYSCNAYPVCRGTLDMAKVFITEQMEASKERGIKDAAYAIAQMRKQNV